MSFPRGPYHVYSTYNGITLLVTFPSRSVADEYWRYVQENANSEQFPIRRCHSQHFIAPWLADFEKSWACTLQGEKIARLPSPLLEQRPDNINGGAYYIRSAVRPNLFWFYDGTWIRLSSKKQTKFIIRRTKPLPCDCPPEEDILIGEDDINIFVHPHIWQEDDVGDMIVQHLQKLLVGASSLASCETDVASVEVVGGEVGVFKFQMFDGGFGVWADQDWEDRQVCASSKKDGGERWEFVQ